jgi:HSP20 family protein
MSLLNTAKDNAKELQRNEVATDKTVYVTPEVNIFETKDGYFLEAELPGVSKEGLDVTVEDNQLTLIGRRNDTASREGLVYRESSTAAYRRVFELNPAIDTSRIEAKIEQGLLSLHLPKSERVKPRKVTVND